MIEDLFLPPGPGWFADDDYSNFLRTEEKHNTKEYVMFDADGPGAIVRFWITTVGKPGKMKFYFDNEENASLEVPAYDLIEAGFKLGPALLSPNNRPDWAGNTLYLPLPYQKHCKITWVDPDTPIKQKRYYQIDYRTYAAGTTVETFNLNALKSAKELTDKVENTLWNRPQPNLSKTITLDRTIKQGEETELQLPKGSMAIRLLKLKLEIANKNDYDEALSSVILKADFDGYPTVWCPIDDFSGSGRGAQPLRSWYREVDDNGTIISRWIMPYKQQAKISVINQSKFDVHVSLSAGLSNWKWDNRCMYFHTTWKQELNVRDAKWDYDAKKVAQSDPSGPIDWNFIKIKGKGVYLGNILNVFNYMHAWYGEGDHKIWADRDTFPSEFGTGLEDYYNAVYLFQTPLANVPILNYKDFYGYNTFTRVHILDAVPFNDFFKFDMEMLSGETGTVDCRAATYWYGFPGATDNGFAGKDNKTNSGSKK